MKKNNGTKNNTIKTESLNGTEIHENPVFKEYISNVHGCYIDENACTFNRFLVFSSVVDVILGMF